MIAIQILRPPEVHHGHVGGSRISRIERVKNAQPAQVDGTAERERSRGGLQIATEPIKRNQYGIRVLLTKPHQALPQCRFISGANLLHRHGCFQVWRCGGEIHKIELEQANSVVVPELKHHLRGIRIVMKQSNQGMSARSTGSMIEALVATVSALATVVAASRGFSAIKSGSHD